MWHPPLPNDNNLGYSIGWDNLQIEVHRKHQTWARTNSWWWHWPYWNYIKKIYFISCYNNVLQVTEMKQWIVYDLELKSHHPTYPYDRKSTVRFAVSPSLRAYFIHASDLWPVWSLVTSCSANQVVSFTTPHEIPLNHPYKTLHQATLSFTGERVQAI